MDTTTPWRPPRFWRFLQVIARGLVAVLARLRVTGDVPDGLRAGPLILAANHISNFDPVVMAAATRVRRIVPRFMATGGLFRTPVVGAAMRACGHIRVDRRTVNVARALDDAKAALADRSVVLLYPEGRIGLDPGVWPERGKTGAARMALASGATVVPVAQWGSHEVLPYVTNARPMLRRIAHSLRHRPVVRVHFGPPVDLSGLHADVPGHAQRATERIIDALTESLRPLRPDEPDRPRYVDPTKPTSTDRAHRRSPTH